MSKFLEFPSGFLWGSSTSAYQVEGGIINDWSEWEKTNAERLAREAKREWEPWQQAKFPEMFDPDNYICGQACDHYNRYEEDFDIAQSLNQNAHRFSLEWSRIEPEEGKFNEKEIAHYRKVLVALRKRNIEPFLTLWHWPLPLWLNKKGGLSNPEFPYYFKRYCEKVAENFKDLIKFWITQNEPTSVVVMAYLAGKWPPQKKNPLAALKVFNNLAKAHKQAYRTIHSIDSDAQVGFTHIMGYLEPFNSNSIIDRLVVKTANIVTNNWFLDKLKNDTDFVGVQYYFYYRLKGFWRMTPKLNVTDMGWEIYPEGIFHILKGLKKYNLPIYITENGLADADDSRRGKYIKDNLKWIHQAIMEGVDVRGYFHWSLLDNFEWDKGFWPKFGLVSVDRKNNFKRTVKPSAYEYAKICQENGLNI